MNIGTSLSFALLPHVHFIPWGKKKILDEPVANISFLHIPPPNYTQKPIVHQCPKQLVTNRGFSNY